MKNVITKDAEKKWMPFLQQSEKKKNKPFLSKEKNLKILTLNTAIYPTTFVLSDVFISALLINMYF